MTPDTTRHWRPVALPEACRRIGALALDGNGLRASPMAKDGALNSSETPKTNRQTREPKTTLGTIQLRPHQIDARERLQAAIETRGGALLADAVGLGKTYVALAVAQDYAHVQVLAPAALLPMWRTAIAATNLTSVVLRSLHAFSRSRIEESSQAAPMGERSLVVIDEAHYLRTRTTARYRNVARLCANRDVLLISATPLHNRPRELRNLLALFLGERGDALDAGLLAECIVRRSGTSVNIPLPAIVEHRAAAMPDNPAVLECILTVATPLPTEDGSAAGALVRLGLLRAWCSSDAALTDTIRRRQLRGEAMLHSLAHGRYPTQRELQSWIVGTDAVQLGFPELLVQTATTECAELLKTLVPHLDSLQALLQLHTRTSHRDGMRTSYLRQLLNNPPVDFAEQALSDAKSPEGRRAVPIIAFSQFASTVRALHRALGDIAGIASLTSSGGSIASGSIPREELIARFAPRSNGRPPPSAREHIRLLLTTDLLAEGVNLQDADTLIHLDLPWTDALRKQRVGRLVRMGSPHSIVRVHTFAPPMGTERALRVVATLERKAQLHKHWVGEDADAANVSAVVATSSADEATELRERLQAWTIAPTSGSLAVDMHEHEPLAVGVMQGESPGFLACVKAGTEIVLVANAFGAVSADTHIVLQVTRMIDQCRMHTQIPMPGEWTSDKLNRVLSRALDVCHRWLLERALDAIAGASSRALAPLQQRALQHLAACVASVPAAARSALRNALANAEQQILNVRGVGSERSLNGWLETVASLPPSEWLSRVPEFRTTFVHPHNTGIRGAETDGRVMAILLFVARYEAD